MLLLQPERIHDVELTLQAAGRDAGGVLVVVAVQSPMRKWGIHGTQLCHQRSHAVDHLLGITGVFHRDGKDAVRNFPTQRQVRRGRQAHQYTRIVVGALGAVSRWEGAQQWVNAARPLLIVYQAGAMNGEARPRMGTKGVHHGFNLARQESIIRIEQADHISGRVSVRGIQVGGHAAMRIAQQTYLVTTADIGLNHLTGIVMRGIVAYDDFRRRIGLLKRALNGLTNISPVVETSDQDGNGWPLRKTLQGDRGELAQPCAWARSVARFCFPAPCGNSPVHCHFYHRRLPG